MHMADALLSAAVGTAMCVLSTGALAYATVKIKKDDLCEKKVPIMAVSGAFIFAAQMINFTIPATGSSGHIGGGILLAGLLGGPAAMLTIAVVLIIQCLFFADGGLLALGSNIFNMGVIPCLIIYPLLFKPLIKKGITAKNLTGASILSVVIGLQLGAFSVVLETLFSDITKFPFSTFVLIMQPIHLVIGLVEGIVTAAVLCFVYKMRPEILESSQSGMRIGNGVSLKKILVVLVVLSLLVGGVFSIFASANPDGLEWSMIKAAGTTEQKAADGIVEGAESIQKVTAFMPDYDYASTDEVNSSTGTTVAGIVGGIMTFLFAGAVGLVISNAKKRKKKKKQLLITSENK